MCHEVGWGNIYPQYLLLSILDHGSARSEVSYLLEDKDGQVEAVFGPSAKDVDSALITGGMCLLRTAREWCVALGIDKETELDGLLKEIEDATPHEVR